MTLTHVFLGSPPFATPILERLVGSPYAPGLVVTPPPRARGRGRQVLPSALAELARSAEIECLQPETVRDPGLLERLRGAEADVFLVVSYGEYLRREFCDLPRVACLNVHPSLLPRHRGASPIPAAILAGDAETGVTIQKVAPEMDAGDVLLQLPAPVLAGENAAELAARLALLSGEAAFEALRRIDAGEATFTPQDPGRVTLCKKLAKEDGLLDWEESAASLDRRVRAMNPWPGARTSLPDGRGLSVWRAAPLAVPAEESAPGTVLAAAGRLVVATGEGALELFEVQAAGKARIPTEAFLRGARLEPGQRLGA